MVDPGFTKGGGGGGGGGHKIMDLLSITKTSKWEVVKNSASPKRPFFIFWPQISLFHLFLNSTPTSNPKRGGGHTLHAYSFSYWDTPTSGQKGGGACA